MQNCKIRTLAGADALEKAEVVGSVYSGSDFDFDVGLGSAFDQFYTCAPELRTMFHSEKATSADPQGIRLEFAQPIFLRSFTIVTWKHSLAGYEIGIQAPFRFQCPFLLFFGIQAT